MFFVFTMKRFTESMVFADEPISAVSTPHGRNRNSNNSRRTSPAAGDQGGVRRSSRQRKSLYSSYDQNIIDKTYDLITNPSSMDPKDGDSRQGASNKRKLPSGSGSVEDNADKVGNLKYWHLMQHL